MIIDLPSTTTSAVNRAMVDLRERGGAVALGRVLTLVIVTSDGDGTEDAIDAANDASREHPCRVIVLAAGTKRAAARLDAQIRVGGDAGASEVLVLRTYGPLTGEGASLAVPLLLPDAPVVVWWPGQAPLVPADDPIGRLGHRRITDAAAAGNPQRALQQRQRSYVGGDTDLAWTRLTLWRGLLAAALDQPPFEEITGATVAGAAESPSADLMAGWLTAALDVPVARERADVTGLKSVRVQRGRGEVAIVRSGSKVGMLCQPGQPERRVALPQRTIRECLGEELRRLDPDEIYRTALDGLATPRRGRSGAQRRRDAQPAGTASTSGAASTSGTSGEE